MSFIVSGYVIKNRAESLTQPESHLLLILSSHGNDNGGGIWPSYNTLALSMKCDRRTVISLMKSLVTKNYVFKKGRAANNKSLTNQYYINVNKLNDEACKKAQQFDDEFNPFETEGVVIHDHPPSDPRSPQGCSTITTPVIHDHPNNTLTTNEKLKQTNARTPASLNTISPATAKAVVAGFVEGEKEKLKGKIVAPREGGDYGRDFNFQPNHTVITTEADQKLSDALMAAGTDKQTVSQLFRIYGNRAHIQQVLGDMIEAQKSPNGVRSPNGFMLSVMKRPYEPKTAVKKPTRVNVAVIQTQKIIESRVEADKLKEALVANPRLKNDRMLALRNANKQGRCAGLVMH